MYINSISNAVLLKAAKNNGGQSKRPKKGDSWHQSRRSRRVALCQPATTELKHGQWVNPFVHEKDIEGSALALSQGKGAKWRAWRGQGVQNGDWIMTVTLYAKPNTGKDKKRRPVVGYNGQRGASAEAMVVQQDNGFGCLARRIGLYDTWPLPSISTKSRPCSTTLVLVSQLWLLLPLKLYPYL